MQTYDENMKRYWERVWLDDGCWPWCGPRNKRGYGHWKFGNKTRKATRIMWELFRGPIPDKLHVLHECDNPCCVNIGHLFLGTHGDNVRDCVAKGRHRPPPQQGEQHSQVKLTADAVLKIVALSPSRSHAALGRMFDISRSVVTRILHGELWGSVTGIKPPASE